MRQRLQMLVKGEFVRQLHQLLNCYFYCTFNNDSKIQRIEWRKRRKENISKRNLLREMREMPGRNSLVLRLMHIEWHSVFLGVNWRCRVFQLTSNIKKVKLTMIIYRFFELKILGKYFKDAFYMAMHAKNGSHHFFAWKKICVNALVPCFFTKFLNVFTNAFICLYVRLCYEFQWEHVIKYLQNDEYSFISDVHWGKGNIPQSKHEQNCLSDFHHFYLNAWQLARIGATYVCFIFSTNISIRIEIVKQISNMLKHGIVRLFSFFSPL